MGIGNLFRKANRGNNPDHINNKIVETKQSVLSTRRIRHVIGEDMATGAAGSIVKIAVNTKKSSKALNSIALDYERDYRESEIRADFAREKEEDTEKYQNNILNELTHRKKGKAVGITDPSVSLVSLLLGTAGTVALAVSILEPILVTSMKNLAKNQLDRLWKDLDPAWQSFENEISSVSDWFKTAFNDIKFGAEAVSNALITPAAAATVKKQPTPHSGKPPAGKPPKAPGKPPKAPKKAGGGHSRRATGGLAGDVRNKQFIPIEERALLDAIAGPESGGRYDRDVGGGTITDFSDHPYNLDPNRPAFTYKSGPHKGQISTASGRYQIVRKTWNLYKGQFGITDFTPKSQDLFAIKLAEREYKNKTGDDLEDDLIAYTQTGYPSLLEKIEKNAVGEWTSAPGGEQPNADTMANSFADKLNLGMKFEQAEDARRKKSQEGPETDIVRIKRAKDWFDVTDTIVKLDPHDLRHKKPLAKGLLYSTTGITAKQLGTFLDKVGGDLNTLGTSLGIIPKPDVSHHLKPEKHSSLAHRVVAVNNINNNYIMPNDESSGTISAPEDHQSAYHSAQDSVG